MDDNRKFNVSGIFLSILLIVNAKYLQNVDDPSVVRLGYLLLALGIYRLMGINRELDI